jgi:hypothetical protein
MTKIKKLVNIIIEYLKQLNLKDFFFEKVAPFISKYLFRWSLKFIGAVLTYLGLNENDWFEFILGAITFLFAILWTLITDEVINIRKDKNGTNAE